ncbi:hypothetical protein Tco_1419010 [Tanacetum coccineum]
MLNVGYALVGSLDKQALEKLSVNARRAADHNRKLNVVDHNQFVIRSLKSVNTKTPQAKHSVNHTKKVWKATRNHNVNTTKTAWRPTRKVVGSVKPQWKPTGRHFALYDNCPLTRIMEPIVEPLELTPSVSSSSKVTMISRFTDCKLSDRKAGSKGLSGGQDNDVDEDVNEQPVHDLALNVDNVFQADDCDAFNNVVDNSLTAELATYKEQVELYERRAKFELTEREQKINEQLRIVIVDRNRKEESLKRELHSVKLQLTSTINHNKSMVEEVTSLKKDFKQKRKINTLKNFWTWKALKEKVEDKLYKQDQSLQTVHMLCKPKPYYDEQNQVANWLQSNPVSQQVSYALYNGHEIIKTNHVLAIVHNSEDTFKIAEITRKKMNDKMKDLEFIEIAEAHSIVQTTVGLELDSPGFVNYENKELLEYVISTYPKDFNPRDKKHVATPLTRKRKVTFADQCETSNNNTHKHVEHLNLQQTNCSICLLLQAGTPSSTTIDQDAPSPSHSPSSSALQSPSLHQGVAAESTIREDNLFAPVDNDSFINMFALEPSSEASSSEDLSSAGNLILSTRKQLEMMPCGACITLYYQKSNQRTSNLPITKECWFQAMHKLPQAWFDTLSWGLWYPKDTAMALTAYADADHAGCQDTRRSTSGSA